MIKYFKICIFIFVAFLSSGCVIPFANKTIGNYNPKTGVGETIKTKIPGQTLLFSILPIKEGPDTKSALIDWAKKNSCKTLENIEMENSNWSFYLISFSELQVSASCIK